MSIFFAVKLDKDDYSAYYAFGRPGLTSYKRQTGQSQGSVCSLALSLAPFVTSRGLLELEKGPSCDKACCRLVRHTEGQAG